MIGLLPPNFTNFLTWNFNTMFATHVPTHSLCVFIYIYVCVEVSFIPKDRMVIIDEISVEKRKKKTHNEWVGAWVPNTVF